MPGVDLTAPKKCSECHIWLTIADFEEIIYKGALTYRRNICKNCTTKNRGAFRTVMKKMMRGAKIRGQVAPDITIESLTVMYDEQSGKCALSGKELTFTRGSGWVGSNVSLDRINPALPYTKDNIRMLCRRVNAMKSDMPDEELLAWCTLIVLKDKKLKRKK